MEKRKDFFYGPRRSVEINRKKILFIITKSVWGGAQKYVYDLTVNLPKNDFEILVAAGPPSLNYGETSRQGKLAEEIKKAGIDYCEIKNFKRDISFISDFLSFFEILKLLRNFKPDIIHVNSSKAGGIVGVVSLFYKLGRATSKLIFTVHGWAFNEIRPKWQIFLIKLASRLTCIFYDKIICVSEFDRQATIKNKIAPEKKLITIHNGIDTDEMVFLSREEARNKIFRKSRFQESSNSDNLIIGTVGEFTKNKGQKYLIDAISHTVYPISCITIIIGWGEEKSNLKSQISKLGLEDKIFLIEGLSPAMQYLKAFDIFILPSIKEGLPYTLLEAGLAGIPVIATEVGGIPEIIENKKTGLLISPADASALASAIKELLEDKNLSSNLAENLRQKIIQEFSLGKMVRETVDIYS